MKPKKVFTLILIISLYSTGYSQNLEEIGVSKGIDLSGSVNLSSVGYWANGIDQRRDPFNWFMTGNLNVNFFGYQMPFSFSYSNANTSYSQPFNQFSFTPQYKWVKTYIGYNSMTFSNYTLAGHVFLGGGVELTPGKWRISAMYGRLRKAVEYDVNDSLQHNNVSYKRMGLGLKVGYENNGDNYSVSVFSAKDDESSLPFVLPDNPVTPMQNIAISLSIRKMLMKRIFIDTEYAVSALNFNTRASGNEGDSTARKTTSNLIRNLLPENATSRYFDALNTSLGYQGNWYSLQVRYERIAPDYQTLGTYYFNSDLQNLTFIPTMRLLQQTLHFACNVGFQRNNLDESKASTTKRFVGSVNANYLPNENWNFTLSYSNFSSFTNMRPLSDPNFQNSLDTLNFYQVSETMSGTAIRNLGSNENPQSVMLTASYQKANNEAEYEGGDLTSNFISINITYSNAIVPSNTVLAISANMYSNDAGGIRSQFYGPTASISKSFFEKTLRGSFATTYNKITGNNVSTSPVWNNRLSLIYVPKGNDGNASHNNFSIGLNLLRRFEGTTQPAFTECTGTFSYSLTF